MVEKKAHRMGARFRTVVSCGVVLLWAAAAAHATIVRTFDNTDFATWDYPRGLVKLSDEGVKVEPFAGPYNAMTNLHAFKSSVIGEHGKKSFRTPSNERDAPLMGDQDPTTWWRPEPADPVDKWWVEIDLGRCVPATEIRVIFPDTLDVHPFRFFSVYTSPGIALRTAPEEIRFNRVGRPVNNNEARTVDFRLFTVDPAAATGLNLVTKDTLDFQLVRFIRLEAGGKNPGAAVAEIEVETVGINLATRVTTEDRVKNGFEVWGGRTWTSNLWKCDLCARGAGAEVVLTVVRAGKLKDVRVTLGIRPQRRGWCG